MQDITGMLLTILILAPPILLALTVHEVSHGVVAYVRGDPTARQAGRLTMNPFRHLDPMGTLVFFITAWMGAGIGWARPVPVNPTRLRDPRHDMVLVSAAGPVANILTGAAVGLVFRLLIELGLFREFSESKLILAQMLKVGVYVNMVLAFFNLIPLPPLDGSGVVGGLLSPRAEVRYRQAARYGLLILLALIFLPSWVPGFPDLIGMFVVRPAHWLAELILPV